MMFAIALGLLAVVLPWSDGMRDCIEAKKKAAVADEFLRSAIFHIPFHSDCTNCEDGDEKWQPFKGRTVPKTVCYTLSGNMDKKPFSSDFECTYSPAGHGGCVLLPGKSAQKPYGANFVVTKTDNKTYMAGYNCVFGYDQFFWVGTTEDKSGDKKFKKKILKHFKDIGFGDAKLADKDGPMFFETVKYQKEKC